MSAPRRDPEGTIFRSACSSVRGPRSAGRPSGGARASGRQRRCVSAFRVHSVAVSSHSLPFAGLISPARAATPPVPSPPLCQVPGCTGGGESRLRSKALLFPISPFPSGCALNHKARFSAPAFPLPPEGHPACPLGGNRYPRAEGTPAPLALGVLCPLRPVPGWAWPRGFLLSGGIARPGPPLPHLAPPSFRHEKTGQPHTSQLPAFRFPISVLSPRLKDLG